MSATFFQRVRICIALIERFGIKRVLIASRATHPAQESNAGTTTIAPTFHRYQVLQ